MLAAECKMRMHSNNSHKVHGMSELHMTVVKCMESMGCTCDRHKVHEIHGLHM